MKTSRNFLLAVIVSTLACTSFLYAVSRVTIHGTSTLEVVDGFGGDPKKAGAQFSIEGDSAVQLFHVVSAKFGAYGNNSVSVAGTKDFTCMFYKATENKPENAKCLFYLSGSGQFLKIEPAIIGVGN